MSKKKIRKYMLDISNADRLMLMDKLPNLHTFKSAYHACNNSSVHLYGAELVSDKDLLNEDTKEIAQELMDAYDEKIAKGNTKYTMTFTHIGWGDGIMAFKVEAPLLGMSGYIREGEAERRPLYVTISTYNYFEGDDISDISRWLELKPFSIEVELVKREYHDFDDEFDNGEEEEI